MAHQHAIDFDAAVAARELGMQQSADHADDVEEGWTRQALGMLTAYANTIGRPFLMEEARAWSETKGLPTPPDARAWGAVTRMAVTRKRIEKAGAKPAASSNLSLKHLWRSTRPT